MIDMARGLNVEVDATDFFCDVRETPFGGKKVKWVCFIRWVNKDHASFNPLFSFILTPFRHFLLQASQNSITSYSITVAHITHLSINFSTDN